ncbi:outer membrane beta-barrel protein [Vibrio algarum]|uniref:Outer membrane beta-barrel protein n=1 Tax=Vibrio algarum TaxID=3020714 RepID=A0ABT4YS40_9VIBR|nr:outer membrane beta-barrel protein [Vibrio sp. KJ40-1]MDB1124354.1 outer membrane beta-barrel protein [Vibrio sp. KJ40-1]
MKKRTKMTALCLLCSTNTIAQDEIVQQARNQKKTTAPIVYPHLFVGVEGGVQLSSLNDAPKEPVSGAYIGTQFTEHWSWDLGYQYHGNLSSKNEYTDISFFDTAIRHDWYFTNDISVYGKLGIAYWNINTNEKYQKSIKENGFSPLAEVGVNYRVTPNVYLNAGYQYMDEVGNEKSGQYDARTLMAGISYHFKGKKQAPAKPTPITAKSFVKPPLPRPQWNQRKLQNYSKPPFNLMWRLNLIAINLLKRQRRRLNLTN